MPAENETSASHLKFSELMGKLREYENLIKRGLSAAANSHDQEDDASSELFQSSSYKYPNLYNMYHQQHQDSHSHYQDSHSPRERLSTDDGDSPELSTMHYKLAMSPKQLPFNQHATEESSSTVQQNNRIQQNTQSFTHQDLESSSFHRDDADSEDAHEKNYSIAFHSSTQYYTNADQCKDIGETMLMQYCMPLLKAIRTHNVNGCRTLQGGIIFRKCDTFKPYQAFYSSKNHQIVICCNHVNGNEELVQALKHELVHAYDACRFQNGLRTCRAKACSEIRAYHMDRTCQNFLDSDGEAYDNCVQYMALQSLADACPDSGKEDVSLLYESCVEDHSPFGGAEVFHDRDPFEDDPLSFGITSAAASF